MVDLRNKDTGLYNLVVTVPGDTVMTITDGFHLKKAVGAKVWAQLTGFDGMRSNVWQTFSVSYGNTGDADARGVPLFIAIPKTAQIDFNNQFLISVNDSTLALVDTVFQAIELDTLFNEPFDCRVYCLMIVNIPPDASGILSFRLKSSSATTIKVWTSKPLYASPLNPGIGACIDDIFSFGMGLTPPGINCAYSALRAVIDPVIKDVVGGPISSYEGTFGTQGGAGVLTDYAWGAYKVLAGCISGLGGYKKRLDEIFRIAFETADHGSNYVGALKSCSDLFDKKNPQKKSVTIVAAYDPNDKLGPKGSGSENYINAFTPLSYNIRFENVATATASANEVIIIDTLDANVFDLSSFELQSMYFANKNVVVPAGKSSYNSNVDLRPAVNLVVNIKAGIDMQNGVVTWHYTALNPQTMTVNENPFLGFLPPNVNSPAGEGGVFFTIKLRTNVQDQVPVKNKAYIYFDGNNPIVTPVSENKLDKTLPHSLVNKLPVISPASFPVNWTGRDTGSGIYNYTIYVSENGKPYQSWLMNTTLTTAYYKGLIDSTYSFYSIARDTAENVEIKELFGEATTTVRTRIILPVALISFTAQKEGNRNRINWKLADMEPGTVFEIERMGKDGRFASIGNMTGKTSQADYIFYDSQPAPGNNYYRLKIMEAGGKLSYGSVALVRNDAVRGNITIAPVPASNRVAVTNTDASLNGSVANVYDIHGRIIYRFRLGATITLDVSAWPAGVYSLRLTNGEVIRMVKN